MAMMIPDYALVAEVRGWRPMASQSPTTARSHDLHPKSDGPTLCFDACMIVGQPGKRAALHVATANVFYC